MIAPVPLIRSPILGRSAALRTLFVRPLSAILSGRKRGQSRSRGFRRTDDIDILLGRGCAAGLPRHLSTFPRHGAKDLVIHPGSNVNQAGLDETCWRQEVLAGGGVDQSSFNFEQWVVVKSADQAPRV